MYGKGVIIIIMANKAQVTPFTKGNISIGVTLLQFFCFLFNKCYNLFNILVCVYNIFVYLQSKRVQDQVCLTRR